MKPQFKPEEIYLDLSKLSEEQIKYVGEVTNIDKIQKFFKPFTYLFFDNRFSAWNQCIHHDSDLLNAKTELTYSQFLDMMGESEEKSKVIENSKKELINNDGTIYIGEGLENYYKEQLERTGKFKVISIDATSAENAQVENKTFDKEFILCASLKFHDNIVSGHRHSDCYELIRKMCPNIADTSLPQREDQGFLTSLNRHVDRREGWKIAKENNQIKWGLNAFDDNEESQLISENLY